jgi:hypothetical protein
MPDPEKSWSATRVAAAHDPEAIRYEPVGPVSLKGLTAPITLYRAARAD